MEYIIDDDLLECFKGSLKLVKKYTLGKPFVSKEDKEAIQNIDFVLEYLDKNIKKVED